MSDHVFVVSEWLPKRGCDAETYNACKNLMALTLKNEQGCIRAHATRQIAHPGSPGKSKYTIILLQEYVDIAAFDIHCNAQYVKDFVKRYIENKDTATIEESTCRLFAEE